MESVFVILVAFFVSEAHVQSQKYAVEYHQNTL